MRIYNFAVLGISETHWIQAGQQGLGTEEMLLYFSHEKENAQHTHAVALMLSKEAQNALIGCESDVSRIVEASLKRKKEGITMNVIEFYTPTNNSNDDVENQFYERLQLITTKCPGQHLTILMRDLNTSQNEH
ncbi:unnamed protein product [Schistosoma curassoni]|uniref:Tick transposon n=1 Tax=Schistosoma curassoni TaxID=6186 RepID=A0A183JXW1_9TREM|nr:unnamed protein product [Schistosoma curassoni]